MIKKTLKKSMAILLAGAVLIGGMTVPSAAEMVYAEETADIQSSLNEKEEAIAPSAADTSSGTIGSFSWSFEDGTLTLSGSGVYSETDVPWEAADITSVVLKKGITGVGDSVFSEYRNLSSVTFPDGFKTIGEHAFEYCSALRDPVLPESMVSIGSHAFDHIYNLLSITVKADPDKLTVGENVFYAPYMTVTIPCLYSESWTEEKQETFAASAPSTNVKYSIGSHDRTTLPAVAATCTEKGNTGSEVCSVCGKVFSVAGVTPALGHDIKTVTNPATATANGSIVKTCSRCDYKKTTTIAKASTINLAATSYNYTGSRIKPAVTVRDANGNKISSSYYTVKYGKNKSVGTGVVKIVFKGRYSGTVKKTFSIVARTAKISSLKNTASGVKITWKKVAGAAGYRIYRGKTLIKTIKNGSTKTYTDTKATTNGKKYTYKVVPYAAKGKGSYKKTKAASTIYLAAEGIKSLTASGTSMTVKYKKNSKATGYKIKYVVGSTSKTVTVKSYATVKKVIKSLTAGKTYKVYVRSYKKSGKKTYYSAWSSVKSVTIPTANGLADPSTCSHTWKEMTPGDTTFWMCPKCGKTVYTDPTATVTPTPTPTPATQDCEHTWKAVYKTIHHATLTHEEYQGYVTNPIPNFYDSQWVNIFAEVYPCTVCHTWYMTIEEAASDESDTHYETLHSNHHDGGIGYKNATMAIAQYVEKYREDPVWKDKIVTVIDKDAYDEKVLIGYYCTKCCAEKKAS